MSNTDHYIWNPNATDKSCYSMDENDKMEKKKFCSWIRWLILILVLIIIVVLTVVFVIRSKIHDESSESSKVNASSASGYRDISIKGLYTIETAKQANICEENQTLEDCVLLYNSKVIMAALVSIPESPPENISFTFSKSSVTNKTTDCKASRLRRNQLTDVFDTRTLENIYKLSNISYSTSNQTQTRSQIDGRSISSRWSSPINYYIDRSTGFSSAIIANIYTAISNWQNNTCMKFNELSAITSTTNKSYVSFELNDEYGCSSPVGYDTTDPTSVIYISNACGVIIGSIMHEIGHTLGYIHTQSRVDRNSYVTIQTANIDTDYLSNFYIWPYGTVRFSDVTFPYDFGSLMHYQAYGFSTNGKATIVPLDRLYERTMGQRERASFYDYKQINSLYCRRSNCPNMFSGNNCQNNGYLDPQTCSHCLCPDGFSGTYCDQRDSTSNCGGIITNPSPNSSAQFTIQNPTPTNTNSVQQNCVYLIQSLTAGKIHFRLESINTDLLTSCSFSSSVEVKYQTDLGVSGARWCGSSVGSAWKNVTAQTNTMMVIFRANNSINTTTGNPQASFRATVSFDAEPNSATTTTTSTTTFSTSIRSSTTITTSPTTTTTTAAAINSSACPLSSFRCQLSTQPTCGGCLSYQPCTTQGSQQCTSYINQIRLTDCNSIVNGIAQCQYQSVQVPYTTTCTRTILLCCPNYQLIAYQSQYYCIYNPQASNANDWSLVL